MAGALAPTAPAGVRWRLTEDVRGFAGVYGIEISDGHWPDGAAPTIRLKGARLVSSDPALAPPPELLAVLRALDVESWEALASDRGRAYRFRPLGATFVAGIFPPMRYTRGLNAEEAELTLRICRLSAKLVGLPTPTTPTGTTP